MAPIATREPLVIQDHAGEAPRAAPEDHHRPIQVVAANEEVNHPLGEKAPDRAVAPVLVTTLAQVAVELLPSLSTRGESHVLRLKY